MLDTGFRARAISFCPVGTALLIMGRAIKPKILCGMWSIETVIVLLTHMINLKVDIHLSTDKLF